MDATLPPSSAGRGNARDDGSIPGLVLLYCGGVPQARVMSLAAGPLEIGRSDGPGKIDDGRISRRHTRIEVSDGRFVVTDLGSQNGTFVDGELATAQVPLRAQRVIRVGDSLLVPCSDVRPLEARGVRNVDGFVRGPAMQAVLDQAARAAHGGTTLHVRGENGTGKEGVAQAFHRGGGRASRPFVAVNCAAVPQALAERLVFGAKRGAYSSAESDAVGYVEEASGGTLFLDEVGELDLQVQAKLLRVLESKEVLPLGASRPRKVDVAFCSATNKDLRALVSTGTLREDLYYRIAIPEVALPPLRSRPEEIPPLIVQELAKLPAGLAAHVSLVEQCLLRPWPGNVRELLAEVRVAAQAAASQGEQTDRVTARHLRATAGSVFGAAMPETHPAALDEPGAPTPDPHRKRVARDDAEWRERIEQALRAHAGNVAASARALGLHRTQLRRLVERYGIAVDTLGSDDNDAS